MFERNLARRSARGVLWGDREVILEHVLGHDCPVREAVEKLCRVAEWTHESYMLAALFNREDLLVEVTK